MRFSLEDLTRSCCDTSQIGALANCTGSSNNKKRKRATNTQIFGENRALDAQSQYSYYIISTTPTDNGILYASSEKSQPFTSIKSTSITLASSLSIPRKLFLTRLNKLFFCYYCNQ